MRARFAASGLIFAVSRVAKKRSSVFLSSFAAPPKVSLRQSASEWNHPRLINRHDLSPEAVKSMPHQASRVSATTDSKTNTFLHASCFLTLLV